MALTGGALAAERAELARLGVTLKEEVEGGHQSRVVRAIESDGVRSRELVIKLTDRRNVAIETFTARMSAHAQVASHDDRVVPIVPLAGSRVNQLETCFAVAFPWIDGRHLDISMRPDVERMGRALARLHQSLRLVQVDVGLVPALDVIDVPPELQQRHQLLHGDFSAANLLLDDGGRLWIFDFDDCGYGPVEFELGNTLFMTLFASSPSLNEPSDEYRQFRRWFLGAYSASCDLVIFESAVDVAIEARGDALRYWLSHVDEAPTGIRTATPEWHDHLRRFVGVVAP